VWTGIHIVQDRNRRGALLTKVINLGIALNVENFVLTFWFLKDFLICHHWLIAKYYSRMKKMAYDAKSYSVLCSDIRCTGCKFYIFVWNLEELYFLGYNSMYFFKNQQCFVWTYLLHRGINLKLALLIPLPWRWRQFVPPTRRLLSTDYKALFLKIERIIATAVRN
jgi:hypothetical protein